MHRVCNSGVCFKDKTWSLTYTLKAHRGHKKREGLRQHKPPPRPDRNPGAACCLGMARPREPQPCQREPSVDTAHILSSPPRERPALSALVRTRLPHMGTRPPPPGHPSPRGPVRLQQAPCFPRPHRLPSSPLWQQAPAIFSCKTSYSSGWKPTEKGHFTGRDLGLTIADRFYEAQTNEMTREAFLLKH